MFNAKDEEIRELLVENNNLWFENTELKEKIFKAIEYIKKYSFEVSDMEEPPFKLNVVEIKELLEILGDKE